MAGTMMAMAVAPEPSSYPGWLLDEMASAGRENLDASHVARYDAKEDAGAVDEIVLLEELGLNRGSVVIDLGAGTGQFAIAAAPACARVIAVDVSPVMLNSLRARVRAAQLTNVDVVQAGFLSYEHDGGPADFVYSRYALHHLPDVWKAVALARLHRILRPGGVLRLWDVVYSFGRRRRIASKPGARPVAPTSRLGGVVRSSRNMCATSTRRSRGFSSR